MKPTILLLCVISLQSFSLNAQKLHDQDIPASAKSALEKKYPQAAHVTWEKEKTNYEANWGGKSGEDNSALFSPTGDFIEIVNALAVAKLPTSVSAYVKEHYPGAKISEAGKVTTASGKTLYEAEVNKKDLRFDENGKMVE